MDIFKDQLKDAGGVDQDGNLEEEAVAKLDSLLSPLVSKSLVEVPHLDMPFFNKEFLLDVIEYQTRDFADRLSGPMRRLVTCAVLEHLVPENVLKIELRSAISSLQVALWLSRDLLSSLLFLASACVSQGILPEKTLVDHLASHYGLYQVLCSSSQEEENAQILNSKDPVSSELSQATDLPGPETRSSNFSDSVSSMLLVELLCNSLLRTPAAECGVFSLSSWLQNVQLVLLLGTHISQASQEPEPPAYHALRICADAAGVLGHSTEETKCFLRTFAEKALECDPDKILEDTELFTTTCDLIPHLTATVGHAQRVTLYFFANWLDAAEDPPLMEEILKRLVKMDKEALIGPVIHAVLLRAEDATFELLCQKFDATVVENDPFLAMLNACLLRTSQTDTGMAAAVSLIDTLQKLDCMDRVTETMSLRHSEEWTKPLDLASTALDVVAQLPKLSSNALNYRTAAAIATLRAIWQKVSLLMKGADDNAMLALKPCLTFVEKSLVSCASNWAQKTHSAMQAALVLVYQCFQRMCTQPRISELASGDSRCLVCLGPLASALQYVEKVEVRSSVSPLCLVPGFADVQQAFNAMMDINNDTKVMTMLSKCLDRCSTSKKNCTAVIAFFGQIFSLKRIGTGLSNNERLAAMKISENIGALPKVVHAAVSSICLPYHSCLPLFHKASSSRHDMQFMSVLLHLTAVLAPYAQSPLPAFSSPWMRYFMCEVDEGTYIPGNCDNLSHVVSGKQTVYLCSCGSVTASKKSKETSPLCCNPCCSQQRMPTRTPKENVVSWENPCVVVLEDHSCPGYCKQTDPLSAFVQCRDLVPLETHLLVFLFHACVLCGAALDQSKHAALVEIVDASGTEGDVQNYLREQLEHCWQNIQTLINGTAEDDVCFLLHEVIRASTDVLVAGKPSCNGCTTARQRAECEAMFCEAVKKIVQQPLLAAQNVRRAINPQLMGEVEKGTPDEKSVDLLAALDETKDITSLDDPDHSRQLFQLFRQPRTATRSDLEVSFLARRSHHMVKHHALALFFDHMKELQLVRNLHPLLKWIKLVDSRLRRQKTRQDVEDLTIEKFLQAQESANVEEDTASAKAEQSEHFNTEERKKPDSPPRKAFTEFLKSWSEIKQRLTTYQGQPLPSVVPPITGSSKIEYCLLRPSGKGIWVCAALEYLQGIQNTFLAQMMNIAVEHGDQSPLKFLLATDRTAVMRNVPLFDAKRADLIDFDAEEMFKSMLTCYQCMPSYGCGQVLQFDFDKIELEVVNELVVSKSFLSLDETKLPQFVFAGEFFDKHESVIAGVKKAVPQVSLPPPWEKKLINCMKKDSCLRDEILRKLELVLSLMQKTGGDPGMSLASYRSKWLKNDEPLVTELYHDVQLKHVVALYEAAESNALEVGLAVQTLLPQFCDALPPTVKSHLEEVTEKRLIPANDFSWMLQRFSLRHLSFSEAHVTAKDIDALAEASLADYLLDIDIWPDTTSQALQRLVAQEASTPTTASPPKSAIQNKLRDILDNELKVSHTKSAINYLNEYHFHSHRDSSFEFRKCLRQK